MLKQYDMKRNDRHSCSISLEEEEEADKVWENLIDSINIKLNISSSPDTWP